MEGTTAAPDRQIYRFGPFRLEVEERLLYQDGAPVPLAGKSFDLLLALLRAPGRLQSREQLIAALWPKTIVEEANLTWNVNTLRKALGDDPQNPRYIETVRGHGYRFIEPVVPPAETVAPSDRPAQKRLWIGAAIATLVAGAIVAWLWWPTAPQPVAQTARVSPRSIAVLPFENLSADRNNAYFTAGIQDEILTRLASIGALKVIARTSTQQYASHPADLETIARQLGVATILEGSVQKVGDLVHVNVQLIDAKTYAHIWAHSYNRKLTDMFGVEGEVAEKIADALDAKLTGAEHATVTARLTSNAAAYDAYLHGLAYLDRGTPARTPFENAVAYFSRAIKLDPRFAPAWAQLAIADGFMYHFGYATRPEDLAKISDAAATALKLAPNLGESYFAEGFYRYELHNFKAALTAFKRAAELMPNNSEAIRFVSYAERRLGLWQLALAHEQQAVRLDPRDADLFNQLALSYCVLRQFAPAHAALARALDVVPGDDETLATDIFVYQAQGRLDDAARLIAKLPPQPRSYIDFAARMRQLLFHRRFRAAIAALANPPANLGDNIGYYYILLGLSQARAGDTAAAHETYLKGRAVLLALREQGHNSYWLSSHLGVIDAALHDADAARHENQEAAELTNGDAMASPYIRENLAHIDVELGDNDAAIAIIAKLLHTPYENFMTGMPLTPALLRLDPTWDPLRGDPRFQALLKQPGL